MPEEILVLGYGAVGRATTEALLAGGAQVRVAQRSRPADLPPGVAFTPCDVLDPASVTFALGSAAQIVVAIGFAYDGALWQTAWPRAMTNLVEGCAHSGARMVFVDNLYMYGAQTTPLTEAMPLTATGRKPAARAEVTRIWQAATGRVRIAALRAPDFYGPGVEQSHLGAMAFAPLARGRAAMLAVPADTPHDFAYVPDIARAVLQLLAAPDSDFGQAWHMPCAPTQTPRQLLALATPGRRPGVRSIPLALHRLIGLFVPMLRETAEMHFQWDRPYTVDARRFTQRFDFVPTPFAIGIAATAASFAAEPLAARPALQPA